MTARLAAVPAERMHLYLMLVLTFSTGIIDAVGFLGLDRVFTGNMTGNVVILGMGIVGAEDLPVLGPFVALVGFMSGAALGGRVLRGATVAWGWLTTTLFLAVGLAVLALSCVLLVVGSSPDPSVAIPVTATLGVAMGVQAVTARFVAVRDVTTVVVTSTLIGLAADSMLGSGVARATGGSGRRFLAVALILVGAAAGAALLKLGLGVGLLTAAVLVLGCTLVGSLHARAARVVAGSAGGPGLSPG